MAEHRPTVLALDSRAHATGAAALLEPLERESLLLNVDASLRVHARSQFFGWTQGLLQNLVRHDLLVCVLLRDGEAMAFQVDSFAAPTIDAASIDAVLRQDTSVVPDLLKTWETNEFHAFTCDAMGTAPLSGGALARELSRQSVANLAVHGTYDVFGKPASLFALGGVTKADGPRNVFLLELIMPFLHLAWVRMQINRNPEAGGPTRNEAALLTEREREILRWVHMGKTNIEIGAILEISPLTVKNHVQKILRKLNVQNRTQAIGKALALRILNI
jgi:transcriptional regulator EpsA